MSEITDKMNKNLNEINKALSIAAMMMSKDLIKIIEDQLDKASCQGYEGIYFNNTFIDYGKTNDFIEDEIKKWATDNDLCYRNKTIPTESDYSFYSEIHLHNKTKTKDVDIKKLYLAQRYKSWPYL